MVFVQYFRNIRLDNLISNNKNINANPKITLHPQPSSLSLSLSSRSRPGSSSGKVDFRKSILPKKQQYSFLFFDYFIPKHSSSKYRINLKTSRIHQYIEKDDLLQSTSTTGFKSPLHSSRHQSEYQNSQQQFKQSQFLSPSRKQLIQDIQKYEEYLKKRSHANLYVPKTFSYVKMNINIDKQGISNKKSNKSQKQLGLGNLIRKKSDSKMFNHSEKMCDSTTLRDQNQTYRDFQFNQPRAQHTLSNKLTARSEVKSPKKHFYIQNPTTGMSQIHSQKNKHNKAQANENQSLFQPQQNYRQYQDYNIQTINNYHQSHLSIFLKPKNINFNQQTQKNFPTSNNTFDDYNYQLIKEQCQYLRNKFIEHVQGLHRQKK